MMQQKIYCTKYMYEPYPVWKSFYLVDILNTKKFMSKNIRIQYIPHTTVSALGGAGELEGE
jgi:hypothetical protein